MGLSADRAFKISEKIWDADRSAESEARHFGETHDQLLARYAANRKRLDPGKLPQWAHSKLQAGRRFALDTIHRRDLTWVLCVRPDGSWACKWDDLTEAEREEFRAGRNKGAHYWTETRKPFNAEK